MFWGETPDISMIRFKFWDPVYYQNWTNKAGEVLMHPGRFVGSSWIIGYPMIFKALQCNEDLCKRNIFLHICVIVPRYPIATGYNYALAPKSGAYFPDVLLEGSATSKAVPLGNQGTVDPSEIAIPEGVGIGASFLVFL